MKSWIIEAKDCPSESCPEPKWRVHGRFTDEDEATDEYRRQADLYGHNTYFRLVQIKRKILMQC